MASVAAVSTWCFCRNRLCSKVSWTHAVWQELPPTTQETRTVSGLVCGIHHFGSSDPSSRPSSVWDGTGVPSSQRCAPLGSLRQRTWLATLPAHSIVPWLPGETPSLGRGFSSHALSPQRPFHSLEPQRWVSGVSLAFLAETLLAYPQTDSPPPTDPWARWMK